MSTCSLVIPVYKNEGSIPALLEALRSLAGELKSKLEVVFVVDGSPDASFVVLRDSLIGAPFSSQLIALSRNFGAFQAIRAGLENARGRYIAVMAADLQEPIHLIKEFFDRLGTDEVDLVFGKREGRSDPFMSRWSSDLFWFLYRKLILKEIPPGGVDVFGCTARVRDVLISCKEQCTSLLALLFWIGFRREFIPYTRLAREHGTSSWSFKKKWNYMLDSIYSFSDLPIRLLGLVGLGGVLLAIAFAVLVAAGRIFGFITVPGYAATVIIVSFFGGLNSLGLSAVGAYVWRSFENTKGRPNPIIMEKICFDPGDEHERFLCA